MRRTFAIVLASAKAILAKAAAAKNQCLEAGGSPQTCEAMAKEVIIRAGDERYQIALGAMDILLDLIPIVGDVKGAIECATTPTKLTCGGALVGVIPFAGDGVKILLKKGDDVIAIAKQGDKVVGSAKATPEEIAKAGSIRDVNPTGGTQNCVNCAIATDNTLAGNPTSALPGNPTDVQVLEKYYNARFRPVAGPDRITDIMTEAGNGARGIVFGSRGPGEVGHVFNVVNQKGTIRFLDGQTGTAAKLDAGYKSYYFLPTN